MRHKALVTFGVSLILLGYGLMESGGRVVHVTCERTENAFLPICHLNEYFLGLFPSRPTETVTEIMALSQRGKDEQEFFLVQRLPNRKLAPIELNKVMMKSRPSEDEAMVGLNRLSAFFKSQDVSWVEARLTNDAGSVPMGALLFVAGIVLVLHQQIRRERRKPKQSLRPE